MLYSVFHEMPCLWSFDSFKGSLGSCLHLTTAAVSQKVKLLERVFINRDMYVCVYRLSFYAGEELNVFGCASVVDGCGVCCVKNKLWLQPKGIFCFSFSADYVDCNAAMWLICYNCEHMHVHTHIDAFFGNATEERIFSPSRISVTFQM